MTDLPCLLDVTTVSQAAALRMIDQAQAEARSRGVAVSVAVIDRGGFLVAFARMDGIHAGTVAVSQAKARSALLYNRPTAGFAAALSGGNQALLTLPDLVIVPGGLPIFGTAGAAGAISVSGAAPDVDEAIAVAGLSALDQKDARS